MDKVIGKCYLGLGLCLDILNIEYGINDYVICKFSDKKRTHRIKIQATKKGDNYFRLQGRNYYLDEFIRL